MQGLIKVLVAFPIMLTLVFMPRTLIEWISNDISLLLGHQLLYFMLVVYSRSAVYMYLGISVVMLLARMRLISICAIVMALTILVVPHSLPHAEFSHEAFIRLLESQMPDAELRNLRTEMKLFFDTYRSASWSRAFAGLRSFDVPVPTIGSRKARFLLLGTDEERAVLATWSLYPWIAGLMIYESGEVLTNSPTFVVRQSTEPGVAFIAMPGRR